MVVMRSKEGAGVTGVSFAGKNYTADEDGFFEIPDEAAGALLSHGLERAERPARAAPASEKTNATTISRNQTDFIVMETDFISSSLELSCPPISSA